MDNEETYAISPIGYVGAEHGRYYLVIKEEYRSALRGLDGFSHINVLWWAHLLATPEQRKTREVEKPYRSAPEVLGIFATRSQIRPNPIALSVAQVVSIDHDKGIIGLAYIDAENNTPIIDLKPYHPSVDRVKNVEVPEWSAHWPKWYEDSADFDWAAELRD